MKTFLAILSIFFIGALFDLFAPWYTIAIIALVISAIFNESAGTAFLSGFIGVFLLWLFTAITKTWGNEGILVERMSALIGVSGILLYLITALMGGIIGGFGSITGYYFKDFREN
jgi:hypothetical protein